LQHRLQLFRRNGPREAFARSTSCAHTTLIRLRAASFNAYRLQLGSVAAWQECRFGPSLATPRLDVIPTPAMTVQSIFGTFQIVIAYLAYGIGKENVESL
jgi:hypothetical protein